MGWIIEKDHISEVSTAGIRTVEDIATGTVKFRLYDDDDILYYEGKADNIEDAEMAYEWSQADSGCTRLDIFENDRWEQV